jgi:hypothetical protein
MLLRSDISALRINRFDAELAFQVHNRTGDGSCLPETVDHDRSALRCERGGNAEPNAARRSGDDRNLAGKLASEDFGAVFVSTSM